MREDVRRIVVACALLAAASAMAVHYGAVADEHDQVQRSEAMLRAGEAHLGETVYVWGHVESTTDTTAVVSVSGRDVTVRTAAPGVDRGDDVQVYGTIRAANTVDARRVVVTERSHFRRLLAVSSLAALLVVGLFVRRWRVDAAAAAFVPRGDDD